MKMHKITIFYIDFEEMSQKDVISQIEHQLDGIVRVANFESADIGEFEDDHELNQQSATIAQHEKYFK